MNTSNYTKIYRILHWAIAISIFLLLFTIFLRLTWMNKHNVAEIIQNYLATEGLSLTDDKAIILAKQIRKPMWIWHTYIGYVLTGLFSIRLFLPFFGKMKFQNPFAKNLTVKSKFQKLTYLIFYLGLAISLITGLLMEFGPENIEHTSEEIHELSLYYLIPFVSIHIIGVLVAEFTEQKGIISKIISGTKKIK